VSPEEKRLAELTSAVREGVATEAEREELVLYEQENPDVQALVVQADREREIGGTWLARAEADRRMRAAENSPLTQAEQRIGVGLMVGGGILGFFFPAAFLGVVLGGSVLAVSVLRVKIATAGDDPYEDVEQ